MERKRIAVEAIPSAGTDEIQPAADGAAMLRKDIGSSMKNFRRANLRHSLSKRRNSLAAHEFSFVENVIEIGDDDEIEILEQNLLDEQLFFDPENTVSTSTEASKPPKRPPQPQETRPGFQRSIGSVRRSQHLEKRKSCNTQAQLWQRASLKVTANNRFSGGASNSFSSSLRQSYSGVSAGAEEELTSSLRLMESEFKAIAEDTTFSASSQEEESVATAEEKKDDIFRQEVHEDSSHHDDRRAELVRRASQNLYQGEGFEVGEEELFTQQPQAYDPWMNEEADWEGHSYEFHILGTSHDDPTARPHVLSPPLMHTLQKHLPFSKRGEAFWLKYSLVRDGANRTALLQQLRGSQNTLLAMETVDGEVFGCFTSKAWTLQPNYFGTGEAFLWRMHSSRTDVAESVLEQAQRETKIDVYPYAYENQLIQLCQSDRIATGGGSTCTPREVVGGETLEPQDFGFGIVFEGDYLLDASSSACLTFRSPSLSKLHADGSKFELINLEAWALTPCITLAEAQRMECHRLFLKRNTTV